MHSLEPANGDEVEPGIEISANWPDGKVSRINALDSSGRLLDNFKKGQMVTCSHSLCILLVAARQEFVRIRRIMSAPGN